MARHIENGYRDPRQLRPYGANPRTHSPDQIEDVRASIRQFGFTNPVIVDEADMILAGHGRTIAAVGEELGQVPVRIVFGLSDREKMAYVIADNQIALNADWNMGALREQLAILKSEDLDLLGVVGFSDVQLGQMFATLDGEFDKREAWDGMPAYENVDQQAYQRIVVHFRNAADVQAFAALVGQTLTENTRFIWHPRLEQESYVDKRYTSVPLVEAT